MTLVSLFASSVIFTKSLDCSIKNNFESSILNERPSFIDTIQEVRASALTLCSEVDFGAGFWSPESLRTPVR